jgi:lysophosphatidate acyltransferase
MLCRNISDLLGLKWELRGGSYLSKDEPYIIVANHQSSIDILGIVASFNCTTQYFSSVSKLNNQFFIIGMFELWPVMKRCTVVAKRELLYAWPFGLAAWLCGLIFIDRLNSESSRQAINHSINELKGTKVSYFIFSTL